VIVGARHAMSFFPSFGYKEVTLKQNGKKYNKVTITQNQKYVYFLVEPNAHFMSIRGSAR
jgi:hypothetical protein